MFLRVGLSFGERCAFKFTAGLQLCCERQRVDFFTVLAAVQLGYAVPFGGT